MLQNSPAGYINRNILQIFPDAILLILFQSAVYKPIFLDSSFFSKEVLNDTKIKDRHAKSIRYIAQRLKLTKGKIPLFSRVMDEHTAKKRKSKKDDYNGPTTDTPP